jgi:protease II
MDYIPLTIIGPKKKRISKMLIHLYGFYGTPLKVGYDNVTLAALERGWTIAYAHVRGGG